MRTYLITRNLPSLSFHTQRLRLWWDNTVYDYYNNRKSSINDLILITLVNIGLITTGGVVKTSIDTAVNPEDPGNFWDKVWDVLVLTVFQDVPEEYKQVRMHPCTYYIHIACT